ncbi:MULTISPECIES: 4-hydroxyphenylacetate catabolism regulator HpaA [Xanthomonas]|uniref:4-hydroxyphenylacetate catabolism regulator HpaA n=1 Tax=Xanthomonas dyei TaxID=743699 RepID=A0ABZ0DG08_9XANT|nr:4-hydroxyphenylacetate catabolism regulator HpaA [Xanthomonas dyei]WOB26870.1 4-hydroxyphenylacetate catabolism regulator HpaA [Xanthomonas dyei]WOB54489.1 4-hydroxyphenylacetate catabolism regulator HpaA [Xanthomonas dyei]
MIRRISSGAVPPSLPTAHGASHHHADGSHAGTAVQPLADAAPHAPRLRAAPPRRRRRGMRALEGQDDELDATELEEAEAARISALRGRVSIAVPQSQGQGQSQDNQHGDGGHAYAGDPHAMPRASASPVRVDDTVRADVQAVIDRYAATRAADQTVRQHALTAAFVELGEIGAAHPAAAPLTTMVWMLMREHLQAGRTDTLAEGMETLRKRLVDMVRAQPECAPALRSYYLLLPLMLISAGKPRKPADCARGITCLNALLMEHHDGTAQGIRA